MLLEHECITKQALFLLYNLLNIYLKKLLNVYNLLKKQSWISIGQLFSNCNVLIIVQNIKTWYALYLSTQSVYS